MALSKEIIQEIETLSRKKQQDEIIPYLKLLLTKEELSSQDLYDYVAKYTWSGKTPKEYVVHADTINKLGVVLSNLKDDNAASFYLLAAKRDSVMGCRNYAKCSLSGIRGAKKSEKTALQYAQKAVELTQNTQEPHTAKDTYARALKANGQNYQAFAAITEYLSFVITQKNQEDNIKNAVNVYQELLDSLLADFNEDSFDSGLDEERFQALLVTLKSIISCSSKHESLQTLRNKACFLAGQYHEFLKQESEAWLIYCQANDKNAPFYSEVVMARKELLKNFVKKQFDELPVSALPLEHLTLEDNASPKGKPQTEPEDPLLLPNKIPILLNFFKYWEKDAASFHSVDELALEKRYKKRLKSIATLIESKNEEIALINKAIKKEIGNLDETKAKKINLAAELKQLKDIKTAIEKRYQDYTAEGRKTLRRHLTETHFFDPKHLKKPEALTKLRDLTLAIIEQRFSLNNPKVPPLSLTGVSSRRLITAERVFQEAVIALSGNAEVALGIPQTRGSSWQINGYSGTNWYGAVERYQVGNTEIHAEHRTSPKRQRLGDSFMPQHGKYSRDIYPFLKRIAANNPDNEKTIARYLIRYSKTHEGVTLEELTAFYQDADEEDVDNFNQIAFLLMEKEQAQWHSATDPDYQLGMSVAQARALRMLEAGFLSLDEIFKNDVIFGVYSQTGIINSSEKVADACQHIEELYTSFIFTQRPNDSMKFFKSQIKADERRIPVLTRQQAREDLRYVYGGEEDSDGEGYDTDLGF